MITKEEIKKVEELQRLKQEKYKLEQDYDDVSASRIEVKDTYTSLNYRYNKVVKIAIKNKIRIINKQIKELLEK